MTVETCPDRSRFFALTALGDETIATKIMEHLFDVRRDCDVTLVTMKTVAFPGIVHVVVVALQTIDAAVIGVIKLYRQHRCRADHGIPIVQQENSC